MENQENAAHEWFAERIGTYVTGGLDAEEQARFEEHRKSCAQCAERVADVAGEDERLRRLFSDAPPDGRFEGRIIEKVRQATRRWAIGRALLKSTAWAAAACVLAGIGYGSQYVLERGQVQKVVAFSPAMVSRRGQFLDRNAMPLLPTSELRMKQGLSPGFAVGAHTALGGAPYAVNDSGWLPTDDDLDKANITSTDATVLKRLPSLRESGNPTKDGPQYFKPSVSLGHPLVATAQPSSPLAAPAPASGPPTNSPNPAAQPSAPAAPAATQGQSDQSSRKVIRHGELSFEVDSFDSAATQIAKIVEEERGYIATTDSEKLANGKVTGTIIIRVPPEHLDVLVLKLRGLGDLKGQKITADDVSKQYTDLQSELRAATAMQDRLLDIIKTGKGEVKDLVAAEKELGIWREKIEQVTGEINYYNNLVAMSTLQVTLSERDIRQAALATETEMVSMGIETDDVTAARANALKAIEDAKGRIVQSEVKQLEAGQFAATIVAEVSPEASGLVIDRLRQLGRVARLDMNRQQATASGAAALPDVKVQRQQTQLNISLYNLANIAPRQTSNINLACDNVEQTYRQIIERVIKAGGRVVTSNLNQPKSDQVDASINFETPDDQAEIVLNDVRRMGGITRLIVTENPDAANVTDAKRGFILSLQGQITIPPRQTTAMQLQVSDPEGEMRRLQDAATAAGATVVEHQLTKDGQMTGTLRLNLPLRNAAGLIDEARKSGTMLSINQDQNGAAPDGSVARAEVDLRLSTEGPLVADENGFWATLKGGLGTSIRGLLVSLELIIIGICVVVPWAVLIWLGYRAYRKVRSATA